MTFSSQFIEVLDALYEKFGVVIDWTSQNVLPYATELAARIVSFTMTAYEVFDIIKALTLPEMIIYNFVKGLG